MIGTFSSVDYDNYRQSGDKNFFEEVIDGVILENYSDDEDLKNYIKSLPKQNKRISTLSLLGEQSKNALWLKISDLLKQNLSPYDRLKAIYMELKDYVKAADVERKQHGEILTPFKELAEPMVRLVEKYDPSFWKNKNHKVLDSSAGYGTFLILAAYKFMVGLKEEIEDEEERFKWIVENCLYYGELQSRSVFSWLMAIDPFDDYKTNIYWGSFLTDKFDNHAKEVWGVEKFDLIIQNPPYQMRKEGFKKTQPLWHLFVQKSLILLKDNGYMVMVHPSGWRNVDGVFKETQLKLRELQILELNIQNEKEGIKLFGADTRFDYYIVKKTPPYTISSVKDQDGDFHNIINLSDMDFIPNGGFDEISSLMASVGDEKVEILHSYSSYETRKSWVLKNKNDNFKYPVVYTVPKGDTLNLMYSSVNDRGHFGYPKLIWSNGRIISVGSVIDKNGDYGLTQFSYGIVDDVKNLDNIKKAFDSDRFRKLMELSAVGDMSINRKVIATFRKDFWKEFI
jgi:hypothetical protein